MLSRTFWLVRSPSGSPTARLAAFSDASASREIRRTDNGASGPARVPDAVRPGSVAQPVGSADGNGFRAASAPGGVDDKRTAPGRAPSRRWSPDSSDESCGRQAHRARSGTPVTATFHARPGAADPRHGGARPATGIPFPATPSDPAGRHGHQARCPVRRACGTCAPWARNSPAAIPPFRNRGPRSGGSTP